MILNSGGIFSQSVQLKITVLTHSDATDSLQIDYQKTHPTTQKALLEIDRISDRYKKLGYLSLYTIPISKTPSFIETKIILGQQIQWVQLTLPTSVDTIPFVDLEKYLQNITLSLDKQGKSFSEVRLTDIRLQNKYMYARLNIQSSKVRYIDTFVLKGYERFPQSHLKPFLSSKRKKVFNSNTLKEISKYMSTLPFVKEIKPPEVLFTKDSTLLYLYLKQQQASSFDGIVNFASQESGGGLLFNGTLDLQLQNTFHQGESIQLYWNSIGNERQEFLINTSFPYIFNSPFQVDIDFNIYKQDSSFLNTSFSSKLLYKINTKHSVHAGFSSLRSNNTLALDQQNLNAFQSRFASFGYRFMTAHPNAVYPYKSEVTIATLFGNRNIDNIHESQYKVEFNAAYLFDFSDRQALFVKNNTGYLVSDTYLTNEVYRIGGANSLRGFNEQTIFTPKYSFFNIEYRYLTAVDSYLYSITDIGIADTIDNISESYLGIGAGYSFTMSNTRVNLGYVLGKTSQTQFNFNNSKLILSFRSTF